MNWLAASIALQVILGFYLQIVEWVNLFPWNDLSHGNGQAGFDIALGFVQLLIILASAKHVRWLMSTGIGFYLIWLGLQIDGWWVPYLWGATQGQKKGYLYWFGRTYKFLPAIDGHPVPDANHVVLQILVLAALIATAAAYFELRRESKIPA